MLHPIIYTYSDLDKTATKFNKDPRQNVGGIALTRYTVPICFGRN